MGKLTHVVVALGLLPALAAVAGDIDAGRQKAAVCATCHGQEGNSSNPTWPNLAGQHVEYIEKQLRDFRAGRRQNVQMSPMAMALSDEDIADLAAYYASFAPTYGATRATDVSLGERLYRAGDAAKGLAACMSCHGPNGIGNPAARYPRLSAQHAEYLELQLKAFKAEARANDMNGIMRDVASRLSNDNISALADYLQGLR